MQPASRCLRASLGAVRTPLPYLWHHLNRDVLVTDQRRAAAVDLQADRAELRNVRVRLGVIDHHHSIDGSLNLFATRANKILVPVTGLERLLHGIWGGLDQHLVAS